MIKRAVAISALVGVLAFGLIGCGNSAATQKTSSAASVEPQQESASSDSYIFGEPEIVDVMNGSNTKSIGTSSIFYAPKKDCTLENLAKWCDEYVMKSGDNWCVVVYSDDQNRGVYANKTMVVVNVGLEQDENDGTYSMVDSENADRYIYDSKTKTLK